MSDRWKEEAKKEAEREHLAYFLDSYEIATGEAVDGIEAGETPDFTATDKDGRTVGIELARIKFDPGDMHWRRVLMRQDWADDMESFLMLLRLMHQKEGKLSKGAWPECERKILVIMLMDYPLKMMVVSTDTDRPSEGGFDEVWLADGTQIDIYRRIDLFAVVHPTLEGLFDVGSRDNKPWG